MWLRSFIVVIVLLLVWLLYQSIKRQPQAFSKQNIEKSIYTLGILALLLIAFVALLIAILR